jgi:hypothetical protein
MKVLKVFYALGFGLSLTAIVSFLPQTDLGQPPTSRDQIMMAVLAGDWGFGNSLMLNYIDHGTGNYSHSGNIFAMKYVIKADGSFVYKFAARYGINTIREWGSGTVVVTRDIITFKFDQGTAEKYKFVALETDTKGDSVLTLTQLNDSSQQLRCGHNKGYFNCTGRQEWNLRRRS